MTDSSIPVGRLDEAESQGGESRPLRGWTGRGRVAVNGPLAVALIAALTAGCGGGSLPARAPQPVHPKTSATTATTLRSTATLPTGGAAKACLLTVDQAAQVMDAPVKAIVAEPQPGWSVGTCIYLNRGPNDAKLDLEQLAAVLRKVVVTFGCSPDFSADTYLINPVAFPNSVPGAMRNGGSVDSPILAPLPGPGSCWVAVGAAGQGMPGSDASASATSYIASASAMRFAYSNWKG